MTQLNKKSVKDLTGKMIREIGCPGGLGVYYDGKYESGTKEEPDLQKNGRKSPRYEKKTVFDIYWVLSISIPGIIRKQHSVKK